MSLPPAFHESLPYIDTEPSPEDLAAARALITAEQSSSSPPQPSKSLLDLNAEHPNPTLPSASTPLDLSRYEAQEPPAQNTDPAALQSVLSNAYLSSAYLSSAYLSSRAENLSLLDAHGKNAWLLGNYQMEAELKALERELGEAKRDMDRVNLERRRRQEDVRGEMEGLERNWKEGVGRALETEVAVEELRALIRDELKAQSAREATAQ